MNENVNNENNNNNDNKDITIKEVSKYEKENYKIKLIVLGDSGVGKTNIINRYVKDTFIANTRATVGVEFFIKTFRVNNDVIKLEIWDTAGQERYKSITSAYYKGSRGALLVYDITRISTFDDIEKWMNEICEKVKGPLKLMLIGNKSDLINDRKITTEMALEKAKILNLPLMETSALNSDNIQKVFENILIEIYKEFKKEKEKDKNFLSDKSSGIKLDIEEQKDIEKETENKKCCL